MCLSLEEIFFANLDFRLYSWEQTFMDLRQVSVQYFTSSTGTYKNSNKGFVCFLNILDILVAQFLHLPEQQPFHHS